MKTIEEQIKVMQHFADGGEVESIDIYGKWYRSITPSWNWGVKNYRIKEEMTRDTRKYRFSNVVIVKGNLVGVIVKTWGASKNRGIHYEVYVRLWNSIEEFNEDEIKHFVYDKEIEL